MMHGPLNVKFLLNSALDESEWSASCSGRFTPVTEPRHPLQHVCIGPRAGLDIFIPTAIRTLDHPMRSLVAIPGSTQTSTFTQATKYTATLRSRYPGQAFWAPGG
jgi:hypothetical protein